jgi:hypothetical protein
LAPSVGFSDDWILLSGREPSSSTNVQIGVLATSSSENQKTRSDLTAVRVAWWLGEQVFTRSRTKAKSAEEWVSDVKTGLEQEWRHSRLEQLEQSTNTTSSWILQSVTCKFLLSFSNVAVQSIGIQEFLVKYCIHRMHSRSCTTKPLSTGDMSVHAPKLRGKKIIRI